MVNWHVSKKDAELIAKVVVRAASLLGGFEKFELAMDLTAVHANGRKLKLAELLAADDFNFCHDVNGIRRHLNRQTGQLENCFVPRFTAA